MANESVHQKLATPEFSTKAKNLVREKELVSWLEAELAEGKKDLSPEQLSTFENVMNLRSALRKATKS